MRVAALYDVHGMPWPLRAVLEDTGELDAIVFGGDFVAGPCPAETTALVRSLDAVCIRGNAEREPSEWVRARLSSDDLVWGPVQKVDQGTWQAPRTAERRPRSSHYACIVALPASLPRGTCRVPCTATTFWTGPWAAQLPVTAMIDGVLYCHATPADDLPITTAITPDDAIAETFSPHTGTIVIGHTHHQFDRRVGHLRVVNAGSVGMPYEGRVAAFWALVADGEPELRSTPVDVDELARGIEASGWPDGPEFVAENVRLAVDRDEAVRFFEGRR